MKPSLGVDLTSILAIGTGAFVSTVLTAVMVVRSAGPEPRVEVEVHVEAQYVHFLDYKPHVDLKVSHLAGPEGPHSGWFPTEPTALRRQSAETDLPQRARSDKAR
jgi:hypothetical protein